MNPQRYGRVIASFKLCTNSALNKCYFSIPQQGIFREVSEVRFPAEVGPLGTHRLCKIRCIDGMWQGPLCAAPDDAEPGVMKFEPLYKRCVVDQIPPHLLLSYKNVSVVREGICLVKNSFLMHSSLADVELGSSTRTHSASTLRGLGVVQACRRGESSLLERFVGAEASAMRSNHAADQLLR